MSHLTDEQLSALADDALDGAARAAAERHLEACADCRAALADVLAQDRALSSALGHDPGEEYFESFVGRVGGRIRAAGLRGAQAREPEGRGLGDWFHSPRKLALVSVVATVVAGAGIVMLATREVRVPALREKEFEGRAAQEAPLPEAARPSAVPPAANAPGPAAEGAAKAAARPGGTARVSRDEVSSAERTAPGTGASAPLNRAMEVRRNAAGEEVPVAKPGDLVFRPPGSAPARAPSAPGEPARVQKQRYAEPLDAKLRAEALSGGVRPAPAEAAAPQLTADKGAPAAEAGAMSAEEAKPAPALGGGQPVTARKDLAASGRILGLEERGPALQVRGVPEAFDGLPTQPRTLAKNAQRLTALAETMGVAPAWDSAAAEWERVIEGVQGGPLESETRYQVARARFMAWRTGISQKRSSRAVQALDAFLVHAPRGAERDTVQGWLEELRK